MTFGARDADMLALQRIPRAGMLFNSKKRRLPSRHGVTFRAFPFRGPSAELTLVNVSVAVRAVRELQLFVEISIDMARRTAHADVSAFERILGLGMVECEAAEEFLPTCCRVACLAPLRPERAFVRIQMTIRASFKTHVLVPRWTSGPIRFVTLLTFDLLV